MDIEGLEHAEKWAVENFGTAELGDLRLWFASQFVPAGQDIGQ